MSNTWKPSSSGAAVGALVTLNATGVLNSTEKILFDAVTFDTDSFWDSVNHRFVIPAGKAGMYQVGVVLQVQSSQAALYAGYDINNSGVGSNRNGLLAAGLHAVTTINWDTASSYVVASDVGDHFDADAFTNEATYNCLEAAFWINYLGSLT